MQASKTREAAPDAAIGRLGEIQQELRAMCAPHYDEFHSMRAKRGFVAITVPKKTKR